MSTDEVLRSRWRIWGKYVNVMFSRCDKYIYEVFVKSTAEKLNE